LYSELGVSGYEEENGNAVPECGSPIAKLRNLYIIIFIYFMIKTIFSLSGPARRDCRQKGRQRLNAPGNVEGFN
jgi:hypothetical protein